MLLQGRTKIWPRFSPAPDFETKDELVRFTRARGDRGRRLVTQSVRWHGMAWKRWPAPYPTPHLPAGGKVAGWNLIQSGPSILEYGVLEVGVYGYSGPVAAFTSVTSETPIHTTQPPLEHATSNQPTSLTRSTTLQTARGTDYSRITRC